MPKMLDIDIENERILNEYIEGDTIFDMVKADRVKSEYAEQVKAMCKLLYANNTNIDYFPTNFVVQNETLYYRLAGVRRIETLSGRSRSKACNTSSTSFPYRTILWPSRISMERMIAFLPLFVI